MTVIGLARGLKLNLPVFIGIPCEWSSIHTTVIVCVYTIKYERELRLSRFNAPSRSFLASVPTDGYRKCKVIGIGGVARERTTPDRSMNLDGIVLAANYYRSLADFLLNRRANQRHSPQIPPQSRRYFEQAIHRCLSISSSSEYL